MVDDPYAYPFLRAAGSPLVRGGLRGPLAAAFDRVARMPPVRMAQVVLGRHRVLDGLLARERAAGVDQVVVLGAGYDARAYRFPPQDGEGVTFFEVDRPALSALKRRVVAETVGGPPPHVRFAPVDFTAGSLAAGLREAGFDAGRPAVFLWEGVVYYLPPDAVEATLTELRSELAAPGSSMGFDVWQPPRPRGPVSAGQRYLPPAALRMIGEPLRTPHPLGTPALEGLLERHGLRAEAVHDAAALLDRGRASRLTANLAVAFARF